MLRAWVLVPALLIVVASPRAFAADAVALRWSAPADCPTGDDVLAEVQRLLGPRSSEDRLDVVAHVQRADDGTYRVRLEIPGDDGPRVREVSAASCAALGQAAALILAMIIDPEAALAAPPAPAKPEPSKPPPPPPEPSKPPPVVPPSTKIPPKAAPPAPRPMLSVGAHLLGDIGTLPAPTLGVAGSFAFVFPRVRWDVGAAYFPARAGRFAFFPSAGGDVDLFLGHASVGLRFIARSDIELQPLVRLEVGRLQATSFGVSTAGEGAAPLVGLGPGGRVSLRLSPHVYTTAGIDGVVLLARPSFVVAGLGAVHTPAPVVVRLAMGVELRF